MKNTRVGFPKVEPLYVDPSKVEDHKQPENPIPICTKPISKEEYLDFINQLRSEREFDRLPFAAWAYEEFPEFAETPEQIAAINAEWTAETLRAKEKNDLEAEKQALKKRMAKLNKMAKKNKAIKIAKKRMVEILAREEELRLEDEHIEPNIA